MYLFGIMRAQRSNGMSGLLGWGWHYFFKKKFLKNVSSTASDACWIHEWTAFL